MDVGQSRPMKPRPDLLRRFEIHPSEQASVPVDWSAQFARDAPLAVELGFGGGEYLAWWAQQRPDWNFVGIELPQDCLQRGVAHLAEAGVENVRLLRGDARYLLRELFAPQSLDNVLMQFPMPWPKEKHAKHRVYSPHFASTLANVLKPGAAFELVTDQAWYAEETAKVLGASELFGIDVHEQSPERAFHTRYEQKWHQEGRETFRVVARLLQSAEVERLVLAEEMKNVHLAQAPSEAAWEQLHAYRAEAGDAVYEVKERFRSEQGWFLYVVSSDASFSQHFYVRLDPKRDGSWLLRVHGRPRPYYTNAVRFLLDDLAKKLGTGVALT